MTNKENDEKSVVSIQIGEPPIVKSEVPLDAAKDCKKEVNAESKEDTEKKKAIELRNVLVVDDSAALRRALVRYLQVKFYCNLLEAENGQDALKKVYLKKMKIDLILCDLMMPVLDGITFLKKIKENSEYSKIPVIFLTSQNDKDTVTKCIVHGACDFIVKPYELNSISKKISKYLMPRSNLTI